MSGQSIAIPLQENFSTLNEYLTEGWIQINGDSNETVTEKWESLQLSNGNGVIAINNIGAYDTITSGADIYYDYLITPYVLLSKAQSPLLTFDLAYASNGTANTDSLVVSYASNCDTTWTRLTTLYGNDLVSTTRTTTSFIPGDQEWKNIRIDVSALPKTVAKFRFEDYSKQINTLYLDNINLYSNPSGFSITIYPVPSDGLLTADVYYEGKRDLQWLVYNELGQKVIDYSETQVFSYSNQIDMTQMPQGIYFVRIISGKDIVQKKVLIY